MNTQERYGNLDGMRAISCVCIIAMHIRANTRYCISGWAYDTLIPSWTLFVYLFLMISGFGMFCGYYEKFRNGTMDLNHFCLDRRRHWLIMFIEIYKQSKTMIMTKYEQIKLKKGIDRKRFIESL